MSFLSTVRDFLVPAAETEERSFLSDMWDYFAYSGNVYPLVNQTWGSSRNEEIGGDLRGVVEGVYRRNGVAAAAMFIRMAVFSEARFVYRRRFGGRPGELWGDQNLGILEDPSGGSGMLLSRMLVDADLAGNAFVARRGDRLRRMRPDWTSIVIGVDGDPGDVDPWEHIDAEVVGYVFHPGGRHTSNEPVVLPPEDVAHFAPIPDPIASFRGMSWLTPVIREIEGDNLATIHKNKFFTNAATPNLVVELDISDFDQFQQFVDAFEAKHKGAVNAYKTLFIGAGGTVKPVGNSFREMDFRNTIGVSEARIAMASGVPATILGTTEGLQGSSLNAGNYSQARRRFADGTMRPLWREACASLAHLVDVPPGSHLWYDATDISFLQEDELDDAEILNKHGNTISQLVSIAGFTPESTIEAVAAGDLTRLDHSGLIPVQQHPPTSITEEPDDE